jgi:hypothetical protein
MFIIFIIKVLIGTKNFLLAKFELGYQNHAKFRADSETVKKNAMKKLPIIKKLQTKIVKHRECLSPSITVSQKVFSKKLFLGRYIFPNYFSGFKTSVKFCVLGYS